MTAVTPCVGVWIETRAEMSNLTLTSSHPAWVCGLKLMLVLTPVVLCLSHPAWVCGLKQQLGKYETLHFYVTPCVGVWIETPNAMISRGLNPVTPCVGVWIETFSQLRKSIHFFVTPCVGVWIETMTR